MADILKDELLNDPLVPPRGYAGMTDQEAADDGHLLIRDDPNPPTSVPAAELWNAFDPTEYDALSAVDKTVVDFIGDLGSEIPVSAGLIKTKVFGIFGAGTTSRTNIIALTIPPKISRWAELELGDVKSRDVGYARGS